MPITSVINDAFSFKKSAKGIADVGRDYFSQAIEIITFCRKIDIKDRPDLMPKLQGIYAAAQDALEAAKNSKNKKLLSPDEIEAAFKKVWELLKDPDLKLDVEEIKKTQKATRDKDEKTTARLLPIMESYEIKKANPPGREVKLALRIGCTELTGPPEDVPTEPFGNQQTLNTVLWLLIQHGKVTLAQNPYFYSEKLLEPTAFSRHFKVDPLSFNETLRVSRRVLVLHVLVDERHRLVLQSQDSNFCRNFGNIWSTGQLNAPVRIVKHFDGTLQATSQIDSQISESRRALRPILGSASTFQAEDNIWDDYRAYVSRNIPGQVTFKYEIEELPVDNSQEQISSPETKLEELPMIPRQTRSKIAEQEKAKEEDQLRAEKQEREAKAAATEARLRDAEERRSREARGEKRWKEDQLRVEKQERVAKVAMAKVAKETRIRDEAERRDREVQDETRRKEDQLRAEKHQQEEKLAMEKLVTEARLRDDAARRAREAQDEERRKEEQLLAEKQEQEAKLAAEAEKRARAVQEHLESEKRIREAEAAAWAEQEKELQQRAELEKQEAEEAAKKAEKNKPKKSWMRRTVNYMTGHS